MKHSDKALSLFLEKIKAQFNDHLKKIILFGSMARGDANTESDYDFLLIFDNVKKEEEDFIEDIASEILIEYGKLFSIYILNQQQFEQMKFEPFIINAQKEGLLL